MRSAQGRSHSHAWETIFNIPGDEEDDLIDVGINSRQITKRMECAPSTVLRILVRVHDICEDSLLEDGGEEQGHSWDESALHSITTERCLTKYLCYLLM